MAAYDMDAKHVKDDVADFLIPPPEADLAGTVEAELSKEQFTLRQLWTFVKCMRTARRSLRSNTAFYSYLHQLFPWAHFQDVKKDNKFGQGLRITIMVNDENGKAVQFSDDSLDNLAEPGYNRGKEKPAGDGEGL